MAASKNAVAQEFTAMIEADRKKKQAQTLADRMLGSGRRSSTPSRGNSSGQTGQGVSLASRVGVTKRSASSTPKPNIDAKWSHDLHRLNNPRPTQLSRHASASQVERGNRILSNIQREKISNTGSETAATRPQPKAQMSIKGMAHPGPWVVIASNFALGTTAADIEAAMTPVGGEVSSCHLLSAKPTVMAEIVFVNKDGAENVIATFNNQKADGKTLYVYLKQGGPSPRHIPQEAVAEIPVTQPTAVAESLAPTPASYEPAPRDDQDAMDVDVERVPRPDNRRDGQRRPAYDDRRPPNGPSGTYEDGRYGFRNSYDRRDGGRDYQQRERGPRGHYGDGAYRDNRNYRP